MSTVLTDYDRKLFREVRRSVFEQLVNVPFHCDPITGKDEDWNSGVSLVAEKREVSDWMSHNKHLPAASL